MENPGQLPYYRLEAPEVLAQLRTRTAGLTPAEAAERLERNGPNALRTKRQTPAWLKFLHQFKDLMIILLLISSLVAFYLHDARTAIVLLTLILFNTTIGFLQEFKAERVME